MLDKLKKLKCVVFGHEHEVSMKLSHGARIWQVKPCERCGYEVSGAEMEAYIVMFKQKLDNQ